MPAFYEYVSAFFKNWLLYMSADPFVLDEILQRLWPSAHSKFPSKRRRRIEVALLVVGVFYAGFAAFRQEYDTAETANQKVKTLTEQLNAMSPTTQSEEIKRLREEIKKLESKSEQEAAREWPPLTEEQISEWASTLAPYHLKQILVFLSQNANARRLSRSFVALGKKMGIEVDIGGGYYDGDEISVEAPEPVAGDIVTLLSKTNYPAQKIGEGSPNVVELFIPDERSNIRP